MHYIDLDNQKQPLGNVFCIGRNYAQHILELKNSTPDEPMVFMKPTQSVLYDNQSIIIPSFSNNVHYECEIVVYINKDANNVSIEDALSFIGGIGIGLDLTARDEQDKAKSKGHPWLKAKGFKGAACLSSFTSINKFTDMENIDFSLTINDNVVQSGNTGNMIYSIATQISYLSKVYSLKSGDIIYTGTPEGVGKLNSGDKLTANLADMIFANWQVI